MVCSFLGCYFLSVCDNFQEFSILCYQWLEYSLHGFRPNAPLLWCWWFLYKLGSSSVRRTRIWTCWSKVCVYGHIFLVKVFPLYFLLCFRWLVSCCIDLSPLLCCRSSANPKKVEILDGMHVIRYAFLGILMLSNSEIMAYLTLLDTAFNKELPFQCCLWYGSFTDCSG